jgi:hypothetical protein
MNEIATNLRAIDRKRLNSLYDRMQVLPTGNDIWYIHTVLAQCFLPYRDPHTDRWQRTKGKYSILLVSGDIRDPKAPTTFRPKYSEGVIRCQSGLGEWFRASQRGVKSLKNQLYGFVSLSCVEEVMGPNSVQQHGMLSLCLIEKSTPCEHVALHNSFAILGPGTRPTVPKLTLCATKRDVLN